MFRDKKKEYNITKDRNHYNNIISAMYRLLAIWIKGIDITDRVCSELP